MKVIYCDGTFDLLHRGHIEFLKKCKSYGDYLIVGLISDKDVNSYKRYPVIPLEDRKVVLENLKCVDQVIAPCPFNKISKEFLEKHNIHMVIYGSPNGDIGWVNHYEEAIKKDIMTYLKYDRDTLSTSKIIHKIKNGDY